MNIALPAIGRDLHASVAGLQWTVDGYSLVLASLLMLSSATADRVGRRRVFQIGLATGHRFDPGRDLRGASLRAGFVPASHADWLLLAAMGLVVFVLGLVTTSHWALDTAARTAATFDAAYRGHPDRYGCSLAIFRRAAKSVM